MIYQTKVRGEQLFEAQSESYGQPVTTFGMTDQGDTPVSLVTLALASCVSMCIQGYFAKVQQNKAIKVEVDVTFDDDNNQMSLRAVLDQPITTELETALLAYIDDKCKVKKMLHPDLMISIGFQSLA